MTADAAAEAEAEADAEAEAESKAGARALRGRAAEEEDSEAAVEEMDASNAAVGGCEVAGSGGSGSYSCVSTTPSSLSPTPAARPEVPPNVG